MVSSLPMKSRVVKLLMSSGPKMSIPQRPKAAETAQDATAPDDPPLQPDELRAAKRIRITFKDVKQYGQTPGCPRCAALELGQGHTNSKVAHNDECRMRIYKEFRRANDDKWVKVQRETERKPMPPTPAPADVDLDAALRRRSASNEEDESR